MSKKKETAEDKLRDAIFNSINAGNGSNFGAGQEALNLTKAIKEYVDHRIAELRSDLEDQINKTGIYDPDY